MNKKNKNKFILSILICLVMFYAPQNSKAEDINVEKINFELGIGCLKQKDYRQAIKYFEIVIQKSPKNIEAHYNLALAYKKAGMAEKSVSEFDKVVKLLNAPESRQAKPLDINKLRQENRILHNNELASDKFGLYSKVKSQENDYVDMGDMHYDNQEYETAVEYYNLALQINPYNDYTYFKTALSYIEARNYINAEPYISRAVELNHSNQKYTYYKDLVIKNIGTKYVNNVNIREKFLNQALSRKDPMQGFDLPVDYKKELFADEEKNSQAVEPFVEPSNTNIPVALESSKVKNNKNILSVENLKAIFGLNQNKKSITEGKSSEPKIQDQGNITQGKSQELDYLDLADLHYDNQEYDTAIEYYTLALNINSSNDYTYYKIARSFLDMKKYKNADEFIDKAISLSSMNKKYIYFKNQIASNLSNEQNQLIANKNTYNFSKNSNYKNYGKSDNLNPNLKMVAEDPKIGYENQSPEYEPDVSNVKNPDTTLANQKNNGVKTLISDLKSDFNNLDKFKNQKINKFKDKNKNKKITKPSDISGEQITLVDSTPSIYGKNMKYFETNEPEQEKASGKNSDYQFEKPLKSETQEFQYSPDYYNEKGIEYYKQDNLQKAENFFKKAVELKPMYAKAYNNLANIEVRRENLDQAILYDLKAVEIDPSYPEAYYNIALIYKKKKDFANEISYLDATIKADPKFYDAYFTKGLAYYAAGNYEQAKYNFTEVIKLKNDHYLASQNLGIIYANELNRTEAENYLKTAIRLNKNNPNSYYYLASVYQASGDNFAAMDNYEKTIELDPTNYKAYLALSKCYENNDEIDRAIDTLRDAVNTNKTNAEPYNYMGLLYLKKDKYIEATNAFQKAVELNPKRSVYHYNLSQSYICLNMKTKAKAEFERAVSTPPANIQDYIDLSEIFYDRSMPSYTIKVLKDGIEALPNNNDYLYLVLANFYEKTGATTSAKKLLQDYIIKKPNGTLSLLIQKKISSLGNNTNQNNSIEEY